jgi:hypothetical protein
VSVYEQVKVALERIRAGLPVRARVRPARVGS